MWFCSEWNIRFIFLGSFLKIGCRFPGTAWDVEELKRCLGDIRSLTPYHPPRRLQRSQVLSGGRAGIEVGSWPSSVPQAEGHVTSHTRSSSPRPSVITDLGPRFRSVASLQVTPVPECRGCRKNTSVFIDVRVPDDIDHFCKGGI